MGHPLTIAVMVAAGFMLGACQSTGTSGLEGTPDAFAASEPQSALGGAGGQIAYAGPDPDPDQPLPPTEVHAAELSSLLAGNTLYISGGNSRGRQYDAIAFLSPDTVAQGRFWGDWGQAESGGSWQITPQGEFCLTWTEAIAPGETSCYLVQKDGARLRFVQVSGSGGPFTAQVFTGNKLIG